MTNQKSPKKSNLSTILLLIIFGILASFFGGLVYRLRDKGLTEKINALLATQLQVYNDNYNLKSRGPSIKIDKDIRVIVFPKVRLHINNIVVNNILFKNIYVNANIPNIIIELKAIPLLFGSYSVKTITIDKASYVIGDSNLTKSYITKVKKRRSIKIEDNEVGGLAHKMKGLLNLEQNYDGEAGYKEIEVYEDETVAVDNSKIKEMLPDIVRYFYSKLQNAFSAKVILILKEQGISIVSGKSVILKEISDINGTIECNKKKNTLANLQYIVNGDTIKSNLVINFRNNGKLNLDLQNSSNNIKSLSLVYRGAIANLFDYKTWKGDLSTKLEVTNLNEFVSLFKFESSKDSHIILNENKLAFSGSVRFDKGVLETQKLSIDSPDLGMSFKLKMDDKIQIDSQINRINLNKFFIVSSNLNAVKVQRDDVVIFSKNYLQTIKDLDLFFRNDKLNLNLVSSLKDLELGDIKYNTGAIDIELNASGLKINNFSLEENNGNQIIINTPQVENDVCYNKIYIKDTNIKEFLSIFNLDNDNIKAEPYEFNAKFVLLKDRAIFYDTIISNFASSLTFDYERKFAGENLYSAVNLKLRDFSLGFKFPKINSALSLKANLMFLNNLPKNFLIKIDAREIKLNDFKDKITFVADVVTNAGFLSVDNLNFKTSTIKPITGNFNLDIVQANSQINFNLDCEELFLEGNLVPIVFNIDKYTRILSRGAKDADDSVASKYWIRRVFGIPAFTNISGRFDLKAKNIVINDILLTDFNFESSIDNGNVNISKFIFEGLGGNTNITGVVDLNSNKSMTLKLDKSLYNIDEIEKLLTRKNPEMAGVIGIGGYFKASGKNPDEFSRSINSYFEFVGGNMYIKGLGLNALQESLINIHLRPEVLVDLKPADVVFKEDTGTLFEKFNGNFYVRNGVSKLNISASGEAITNKFVANINNNNGNTIIDLLNTSCLLAVVGSGTVPLYISISFKEDMKNKALLKVNVDQVEQFLKQIREQVKNI